MLSFLIKIKNAALDAFFPPICLNCRKPLEKEENLICSLCLSLIKINNTLFCPVCRARLADNKRICHYNSPYLLAAAGNYDDPILQNLIHCFKYKSLKNLAPVLGEITLTYIGNCKLEIGNFIVVPVPLHRRRERQRGFNQAKLLGEIISKKFNLGLSDDLKRTKNNKPQVECRDKEARAKNIENCFEIKNPEKIRGKNILLIDDVFTSGATMNEAAKILKENRCGKIIALVLAKA